MSHPPSAVVDVAFRLFAAVAPVSLSTTESYALTTNPRLRPLPVEIQERIRRVALEAAVEPSTLPSSSPAFWKDPKETEEWVADSLAAPPAFLAYTRDVGHKCVALPALRLRRAHEDEADGGEEREEKRKRRRRRKFPPAQFWRPPPGVVPRGYGYGWSV